MSSRGLSWALGACLSLSVLSTVAVAHAQSDSTAVLEVGFTPTPRAQLAIWIEDSRGRFLANVGLTESVAYRGVGNRPGASQMNSGYRWPYGRREGVLPIWARRRAAAHGAERFKRVIFQDRTSEGLASRTSDDQSAEDYYCLSFQTETTRRDALDAVSCATPFHSDKGRYMTGADVLAGYAEPWVEIGDSTSGAMVALPEHSFYPPRMDVVHCGEGCFDHADIESFAQHAREVMPEIDAITMATPPGGVEQSLLYSVPSGWPGGDYRLLVEVHTEGDYNDTFNDVTYPTPTLPNGAWDSWAITYGYPYRGQPSVVYQVAFTLGLEGETVRHTDAPIGRSSWEHWQPDFGQVLPLDGITDDPVGAEGSGADRLMMDGDGHRITLTVRTLGDFEMPEEGEDPWADIPLPDSDPGPVTDPGPQNDEGEGSQADTGEADVGTAADVVDQGGEGTSGDAAGGEEPTAADGETVAEDDPEGEAVILTGGDTAGSVGPVRGLSVEQHSDRLHAHEWVHVRFLAAESDQELHSYEVRVATAPITDAASFIRAGRPAKTATRDAEGAVSLMLPTDVPPGEPIEDEIGDLVAETDHWIAVRAKDIFDRKGPISVVQVRTRTRVFATVTPCFVATAAHGTALAAEVGVLRRVRDRLMLTHAPGRWLVARYYEHGPALADAIRERPWLRAAARAALRPLVWLGDALR